MPSEKKFLESWGYDRIGFESDNDSKVKKIWCKVCREYSDTVIGNVGHLLFRVMMNKIYMSARYHRMSGRITHRRVFFKKLFLSKKTTTLVFTMFLSLFPHHFNVLCQVTHQIDI